MEECPNLCISASDAKDSRPKIVGRIPRFAQDDTIVGASRHGLTATRDFPACGGRTGRAACPYGVSDIGVRPYASRYPESVRPHGVPMLARLPSPACGRGVG